VLRFVAVALCLCAGPAKAEAEWVLGGYLGAAHTMTAPLSVAQPIADTSVTLASVEYDGGSFTPPLYYGYRVAYFLPDVSWLGFEAEVIHLKAYARTDVFSRATGRVMGVSFDRDVPVRVILESFSISHGLNLALFNVVVRRALSWQSDGRVTLLARGGIGPTLPHAESRIGGVFTEGYEIGAPGVQVATGIEVRLARGLAAIAEYKLTTTNQSVSISEGEAHGRFTSHHGVFGLTWHL
jgi:hypothetical protein